ncbi:polypyrimidine tract-binding protein homolog 3 [Tanacetum coccineum]|uniref:Polypyrimidine tract-binding protein homolog 3 n=1 Tax=Tanacetum coccineum TaxID=301880 RepID=A0ABQ5IWL3_9ASTR
MASNGSERDMKGTLSKLLQMGTVAKYESEFLILANRVTEISQSLLTSFYISGLKLELQRELFRSWPTTLGEAFSLASILEARFEDEQSTIAIAKPNKLTARVHLQDLEQTTQERGGEPNHILLVMIHHMIYPITMEVLHQVFSPLGVQLDIQFSNLEELQENQEEHICYYYWENCFSILNAEEADNTKPPLPDDTFAKEVVDNGNDSALIFLVGYGTRSEVKSLENWKELDNESEDRKVERDAEREGEPNIFTPFGSDRARTCYSGANLSLPLLYILKELAHVKSDALS